MLYENETYQLRQGLFHVQNEVGIGRREEAYHRAYKIWLSDRNIPFHSKKTHILHVGPNVACALEPDFVVWDKIIVELKALPRCLRDEDKVQIYDYLKCRDDKMGLLVNLGLDRVHVDRVIWETPERTLKENWDYWAGAIAGEARSVGLGIRNVLRSIYQEHSTGYGQKVTEALILRGLEGADLKCVVGPQCTSSYNGHELHLDTLDCWVIEDKLLLVHTALFDLNDFNISRGLSYMKSLGLEWGIAANFGKKTVEITGLRKA